jgi:hypothetical protein
MDFDFFKPVNTDTPATAPTETVEGVTPPVEDTQPGVETQTPDPDELAKVDELTRKYFGFGSQEIASVVTYFQEQQREKEIAKLKDAWGENFDEIYSAVEERLKTLPPEKQMVLNNVEGAMLLANVISQERSLGITTVPRVEKGEPVPSKPQPTKYKLSELIEMRKREPAKYAELRPLLDEAFSKGLVEYD